jgi:hypothetical protein
VYEVAVVYDVASRRLYVPLTCEVLDLLLAMFCSAVHVSTSRELARLN